MSLPARTARACSIRASRSRHRRVALGQTAARDRDGLGFRHHRTAGDRRGHVGRSLCCRGGAEPAGQDRLEHRLQLGRHTGIRGQPRSARGVLEQLRRAGQEGHVGRDELDGRAPRGRAAARAREAGEDLRLHHTLDQAHGLLRLGGLTEDGEHHPARDARRVAPRPCRHVHESEVVPHLAVRHAQGFREGLALVAAAEAQRRVSVRAAGGSSRSTRSRRRRAERAPPRRGS